MFDSSADGIVVTDSEHRLAFMNPAAERIVGADKREILGDSIERIAERRKNGTTQLFAPDGETPIPADEWPLARMRRGETIDDQLYAFRHAPDADPLWVAVSARTIRDDAGTDLGAVEVLHDETARRRLEAQLEQSRRVEALGQLTGGVAHDFNNLLLVILGNAEGLERQLADRPNLQRQARMILDAGGRAADLTGRLLAFGRRQLLQPTDIAINPLIEGTVSMLRRVLGENIDIVLGLDPAAAAVRADPSQLEVALLNLAVNARDAMPKGGRLTIETRNVSLDAAYVAANPEAAAGDYVLVAVSDTGTGMPRDVVERAFEPFFPTKPLGAGTGLGLSSVHGFVRQTGGHVKLYSEIGRGTVVNLYLPVTA
ncbi:MAG: PAS domain S-box protein, partial [Rhodospirillaceae bacterium]|nr:PAS domain S-box protein [Rhodospirillaceae bacterium]